MPSIVTGFFSFLASLAQMESKTFVWMSLGLKLGRTWHSRLSQDEKRYFLQRVIYKASHCDVPNHNQNDMTEGGSHFFII